jgi:hypothetical protein
VSGLAALLAGRHPPGLYVWRSNAAGADVAHAAEKARWTPFVVDGRSAATKGAFLDTVATACAFPSWFGHNWDALADCLADLSWAPSERGYLVVYDGWGMLAWTEPQSWHSLRSVFREACSRWAGTPTPMAVLLRGPGPADDLPELS